MVCTTSLLEKENDFVVLGRSNERSSLYEKYDLWTITGREVTLTEINKTFCLPFLQLGGYHSSRINIYHCLKGYNEQRRLHHMRQTVGKLAYCRQRLPELNFTWKTVQT